MTELGEKDQEWLFENESDPEDSFYCARDYDGVKQKLLEKQAEIDALKAHVEHLVDVVDEVSTATNANMLPQEVLDLAANAIASVPQQSLAQHDKQVKIDTLNDIKGYLYEGSIFITVIDAKINQLKE